MTTKEKILLICAGIFLVVTIILGFAYIKSVAATARAEARSAVTIEYEQKAQETSKAEIKRLEDYRKDEVARLEKEKNDIKTAKQAQQIIYRDRITSTPPTVTTAPVNAGLPDAPSTIHQAGMLCYDEQQQVELARYSDSCQQWKTNASNYAAQIVEKDKMIKSKDTTIKTLEDEKHPSFRSKAWTVIKWGVPIAAGGYIYGRLSK